MHPNPFQAGTCPGVLPGRALILVIGPLAKPHQLSYEQSALDLLVVNRVEGYSTFFGFLKTDTLLPIRYILVVNRVEGFSTFFGFLKTDTLRPTRYIFTN